MQMCSSDPLSYWRCVSDSVDAAASKVGSPLLSAYVQHQGGHASSSRRASAGGLPSAVRGDSPALAAPTPIGYVPPEKAIPLLSAIFMGLVTATAAPVDDGTPDKTAAPPEGDGGGRGEVADPQQGLPHERVWLGDLDLSRPRDVARAYDRIRLAAVQVCPDTHAVGLWARQSARACVEAAVGRAVGAVASPLLTAYVADRSSRVVRAQTPPQEHLRIVLGE
jgi:UrcA family protein